VNANPNCKRCGGTGRVRFDSDPNDDFYTQVACERCWFGLDKPKPPRPSVADLERRVEELERDLAETRDSQGEYRSLDARMSGVERERDELRALAGALVDALPRCDGGCGRPATRALGRGGRRYCDEHGGTGVPEYPRAAPLRVLQAWLARGSRG
jgi:hypothetical protein